VKPLLLLNRHIAATASNQLVKVFASARSRLSRSWVSSSPFRIVLLPDPQKVLIDQSNYMQPVGHDGGAGEVLPGDAATGCRQLHDDDLNIAFAL
jgi:hypothetical protein